MYYGKLLRQIAEVLQQGIEKINADIKAAAAAYKAEQSKSRPHQSSMLSSLVLSPKSTKKTPDMKTKAPAKIARSSLTGEDLPGNALRS